MCSGIDVFGILGPSSKTVHLSGTYLARSFGRFLMSQGSSCGHSLKNRLSRSWDNETAVPCLEAPFVRKTTNACSTRLTKKPKPPAKSRAAASIVARLPFEFQAVRIADLNRELISAKCDPM